MFPLQAKAGQSCGESAFCFCELIYRIVDCFIARFERGASDSVQRESAVELTGVLRVDLWGRVMNLSRGVSCIHQRKFVPKAALSGIVSIAARHKPSMARGTGRTLGLMLASRKRSAARALRRLVIGSIPTISR